MKVKVRYYDSLLTNRVLCFKGISSPLKRRIVPVLDRGGIGEPSK